ncbi:unnamed protein product [Penicillium pancosmium]
MGKTSNEKRGQLKQQCREAMSAHIYDRLGVVVEPIKVRLQPSVEDGYAWSVTASHAYLLKTHLSHGGVGFFQTICKELGRSLEAVTPETLQNGLSQAQESPENDSSGAASKEEGSFTAKIRELEATNRDLRGELDQTSTRLESALDEGRTLRAKNCQLEREVETSISTVKRQEEELARLRGGIGQVMQVLGNLYPQNNLGPRETSAAAEP